MIISDSRTFNTTIAKIHLAYWISFSTYNLHISSPSSPLFVLLHIFPANAFPKHNCTHCPNRLVWTSEKVSTTVLGSTHVVEQLSFSMFPSILTFYFDLVLGSFFNFWGPNGLFLRLGQGSETDFGSFHVVEQLSFSMFLSLLAFEFGLILGSFLSFWEPNELFSGLE